MNYNSLLCVGDLQNNPKYIDEIIRCRRTDELLLFVGDYLDSFVASPELQVESLKKVLALVDEKKAIALYGNHELHYLMAQHRASGWNPHTDRFILHMKHEFKKLKPFHFEPSLNLLISHAGLTNHYYVTERLDHTKPEKFVEDLTVAANRPDSWAHNIGRARGGWAPRGGLFWCDWNLEFNSVPGLWQIVGHTRCDAMEFNAAGDWNIDCLGNEFALFRVYMDGKTEVVNPTRKERA